jgi:hypothetical protein
MRAIAIDPGHTTGYAIYDGEIVLIDSLSAEEFIKLLRNSDSWYSVFLESTPVLSSNNSQSFIHHSIEQEIMCRTTLIQFISPGVWKPFARAMAWRVPLAVNQHEKDAYNILRYGMLSNYDIRIESNRVMRRVP